MKRRRGHFRVIEENIIDCSSFFRKQAANVIHFAVKPKFVTVAEWRGDVRKTVESGLLENSGEHVLLFLHNGFTGGLSDAGFA